MSDPKTALIAKVKRLIMLAGSSNENEARNAAVLACKLIREGGLDVGIPVGTVAIPVLESMEEVDHWIRTGKHPRQRGPSRPGERSYTPEELIRQASKGGVPKEVQPTAEERNSVFAKAEELLINMSKPKGKK